MKTILANNVRNLFVLVMSSLILCFIIGLLFDPQSQLNVFFRKTENLFADFFNIMIWIADKDPYFNTYLSPGTKSYFPLSYLILMMFSGIENYSGLQLEDVYSSTTAIVSCMLFTLGSIFLYFHSLTRIVKCHTIELLIISLSSVFLFTIERGNLIMFTAALTFYFIAYKDSRNIWLRRFSLLALCVASVLKVYPVVLGIYLLKDKRYKDIFLCVILSLLLIFIPFLAFEHGFDNIPKFIENVAEASKGVELVASPRYGLHVFSIIGCSFFRCLDTNLFLILLYISKIVIWAMAGLSVFLFFFEKETWKQLLMITMLIAYLPQVNFFYCGIYFVPFIMLFLFENPRWNRTNILYALLMCVFLNPFQIVFHNVTISWMLSNLAMLALWVTILVENILRIRSNRVTPTK